MCIYKKHTFTHLNILRHILKLKQIKPKEQLLKEHRKDFQISIFQILPIVSLARDSLPAHLLLYETLCDLRLYRFYPCCDNSFVHLTTMSGDRVWLCIDLLCSSGSPRIHECKESKNFASCDLRGLWHKSWWIGMQKWILE